MNFYFGKSAFCKWWSCQRHFLFEGNSTRLIYSIDSNLKDWSYIVSKGSEKPLYKFGQCWKKSGSSGGKISSTWTKILPSIKAGIFTVDLWIQFALGQKLSSHILSILFPGSWARSSNGDGCEKLLQYFKN